MSMRVRKPITAELVGGKGNRQRLWDAIRRLGIDCTWRRREVCKAANVHDSAAETYLQGLEAAGYIALDRIDPSERVRGTAKGVHYYRLVRDAGAEAPRVTRDGKPVTQGLRQEQMWRALRMIKADTNARELAAHASSSTAPVSAVAAEDYLRTLQVAGYLDITREQPAREGGYRYRLKPARNTGPRPPMICRTQAVYDPNEHRVVWQREVTEEDCLYGR